MRDGKAVGSSLISQSFQDPKYFWGRAVRDFADAEQRDRLGRLELRPDESRAARRGTGAHPGLEGRRSGQLTAHPGGPGDRIGSGLDPHMSPAAALYQVDTGRAREAYRRRQGAATGAFAGRAAAMGIFGEARVNVLLLNLSLDRAQ